MEITSNIQKDVDRERRTWKRKPTMTQHNHQPKEIKQLKRAPYRGP